MGFSSSCSVSPSPLHDGVVGVLLLFSVVDVCSSKKRNFNMTFSRKAKTEVLKFMFYFASPSPLF